MTPWDRLLRWSEGPRATNRLRQEMSNVPWNPWIETDNEETDHEDAKQLFRKTRGLDGEVSDLVRITSRTPEVAQLIHDLGGAVYRSAKGLSLREKEIAALITSSYVGCVH